MKPGRILLMVSMLLAGWPGWADEVALVVKGEVKSELRLTLADLEGLANSTVALTESGGSSAKYEGVFLHQVLSRAGVPFGEGLRGDALRLCVLVKAADGYRVAFALAELDPGMTEKRVLLAFRRDGKELNAETGPLRLVVPDEKRHSRWVRRVTELEVIRLGGPAKP